MSPVAWVLVCVLIGLFGLGFLGLHAREVFRKGKRLFEEIDEAARRIEAVDAATATEPRRARHRMGDDSGE